MENLQASHNCHFMLEQTVKGYFTGKFVCTICGMKIGKSDLFDSLTLHHSVPGSGQEPSRGLSRSIPEHNR